MVSNHQIPINSANFGKQLIVGCQEVYLVGYRHPRVYTLVIMGDKINGSFFGHG